MKGPNTVGKDVLRRVLEARRGGTPPAWEAHAAAEERAWARGETVRQRGDEVKRQVEFAFADADTDGSGEMDLEAFAATVRRMGLPIGEAEVEALFHEIDADGSGDIDVDEFWCARGEG